MLTKQEKVIMKKMEVYLRDRFPNAKVDKKDQSVRVKFTSGEGEFLVYIKNDGTFDFEFHIDLKVKGCAEIKEFFEELNKFKADIQSRFQKMGEIITFGKCVAEAEAQKS